MAKKKVSQNQHQSVVVETTKPTNNSNSKPEENASNEKLESLKSLNSMLLREAVERRQQVDSLIQAKGSLESVLTRANSAREEMMTELTQSAEEALRLEIERGVVFDFIGLHFGQISESRERIEREMREVLKEKSDIEKAKSERDREVLVLEEKIKGLLNQIGLEKGVSGRMERERNELEIKLGLQVKETEELSFKVIEMEGKVKGVKEEMEKLGKKYAGVVEENEGRKTEIKELTREKALLESKAAKVIGEMEGKIVSIQKEKEGIEQEMRLEKLKRVELESTVSRLNGTVLKLDKVEERLRMDMAELEKECGKGVENQREMATEIDQLVGEKNEMSKALKGVVEEKKLVQKNLDYALKQLGDQKKETEMVENEKTKILEALSGKECEIGELQRVVSELREVVNQLESSCNEGVVKIKNLESEVDQALVLVTVERDEGKKLIDQEKKKGLELMQKINDMSKMIEESAKLVEKMKAENSGIKNEKDELENICGKFRSELASAESSLVEVRKEFDRFRSNVELEKESSMRVSELEKESSMKVLTLLKGTVAELVSSMDDEKFVVDGENIAEFEKIKNAFKRKVSKGEEMKREIEVLKNSVAEEHKKKSFWTLMSSATTILATVSLAYIARGH